MLSSSSLISYNKTALHCYSFKLSVSITSSITAIKIILLLPLSTFVLHHGHQKWQRQRSFNTSSHSDIFTYHLAAMELIWVFGCSFFLAGVFTDHTLILTVGMYCFYIPFYGELVFNLLTCVERYLAVVHPLTYRVFKNVRGIRIRNTTIGCAWIICLGLTTMFRGLQLPHAVIFHFGFFVLSILTVSFCSVSVLCILIRPGPKEGGSANHSRRRAFCTITVISSVVWLWFVGLLAYHSLIQSVLVDSSVECLVVAAISWFSLPCSLVLPLLYLQKKELVQKKKLCCCS